MSITSDFLMRKYNHMNNSTSIYAYIFRLKKRINLHIEEAGQFLDNGALGATARCVEHIVIKVGKDQYHRWIPKVSE